MMIEDEELRNLYRNSSQDRLAKVEAAILAMERNHTKELNDTVLRELHSLKGDSRMLGITKAEQLAHHIEELFIRISRGEMQTSDALYEAALSGLDGLKELTKEGYIPNYVAKVSVFTLVTNLMMLCEEEPSPSKDNRFSAEQTDDFPFDENIVKPSALNSEPTPVHNIPTTEVATDLSSYTEQADDNISDIQVPISKLEKLMQYISQLTVAQQQIMRKSQSMVQLTKMADQLLSYQGDAEESLMRKIELLQKNIQFDVTQIETISRSLELQIHSLQMISFSTIFNSFSRTVRDLSKKMGKEVRFEVNGGHYLVDRKIVQSLKAPLIQMIRNSIDHGIEMPEERIRLGKHPQGLLELNVKVSGDMITIELQDDGKGLDKEQIVQVARQRGIIGQNENIDGSKVYNLIFQPGFSTRAEATEISGRGVGLDVVKNTIDMLKGKICVTSIKGQGCHFTINLKLQRLLRPIFLTKCHDCYFGIPLDNLLIATQISSQSIVFDESKTYFVWEGKQVTLSFLSDVLNLNQFSKTRLKYPCLIYKLEEYYYGIIVDELVDYREIEVVLKNNIKGSLEYTLGTTLLESGDICYILNHEEILGKSGASPFNEQSLRPKPKVKVLLVEDSIPIGTQMTRILKECGFEVEWAKDGESGYQKYSMTRYDCIVSDVEMPHRNGIELLQLIRQGGDNIPFILLTTLASEKDRERGMLAGANHYLTKGDFDQEVLKQIIKEMTHAED